ncbi:MAG: hypothetical protein ACRDJE_03280, partial [Dehalococcoidia bacterium]
MSNYREFFFGDPKADRTEIKLNTLVHDPANLPAVVRVNCQYGCQVPAIVHGSRSDAGRRLPPQPARYLL